MASSLRNKFFIFSILSLIVLACVRCGGETEKTAAKKDSLDCAKPLNPNGDSELSVLMREMMSSSQNMKEMVLQGNLPTEFPEAFLKIHTAQPTDSDTKKASFESHADHYILNLRSLYQSPKEDLTSNYNALINSCISCHGEHCPGPIKAIEKLKI
jgi:hypothetical protein